MKIYCKGISTESIDFIVERRLKAYIADEYAVVTVADDFREYNDFIDVYNIDRADYICILFSPEMIVPDLKYIVEPSNDRDGDVKRIIKFKISFFETVVKLANESGSLTRAEATRLIWNKFVNSDSSANTDSDEIIRLIDATDNTLIKKWIEDSFIELIIKYSAYITCWEKAYGYNSLKKYVEGELHVTYIREGEGNKYKRWHYSEAETRRWFNDLIRPDTQEDEIPQIVRKIFKAESLHSAAANVENSIYEACNINIDRAADMYRKFFFSEHRYNVKNRFDKNTDAKKDYEKAKTTLLGIMLFANCFDYCYMGAQANKQQQFEWLLNDEVHLMDISYVIERNLTAASEIVLMHVIKLNQEETDLLKDKKWVGSNLIDIVDEIEAKAIPIVLTLLKNNNYKDEVTPRLLITEYNNQQKLQIEAKKVAIERLKSLTAKDGGLILGSFFFFASENPVVEDGIPADKKTGEYKRDGEKKKAEKIDSVRNRARSFERNYWTQRKKNLLEINDSNGLDIRMYNEDIVEVFLKYLINQNRTIRRTVLRVMEPMF